MGLFVKGQTPLALKKVKFSVTDDTYIFLRELSSKELLDYQATMGDKATSNLDFVYDLISRCACDDNSNNIFTDAADVKENLNVGLSTLVEMQKTITNISGLTTPN
jgi:hypothetical protein